MLDAKLAGEVRPYLRLFLATIVCGMAGGMFAVMQAETITRILTKTIFLKERLAVVQPLFTVLVMIIIGRAVSAGLMSYCSHKLAENIKYALRVRLISHLLLMTPGQLAEYERGAVLTLVTQGVEEVEQYFARLVPQLVFAALVPFIVLLVVLNLDRISFGLFLGTAFIIPIFMVLIGHSAKKLSEVQWGKLTSFSARFFDTVMGFTTLKLFGRSQAEAEHIGKLADEMRRITVKVLRTAFLSAFILELFSTIGTALVAVAVGLKLLYGSMNFYQTFFILLLAPEFYLPLRLLGSYFHAGLTGTAAAEKMQQVWDVSPPVRNGKIAINERAVRIEFAKVDFSYPYKRKKAADKLSFTIEPGDKVALVGASGAGKSTAVKLLLGFLRPSGGQILLNGVPLEEAEYQNWLNMLAYIPQQPHLFQGTIAENICLGKVDYKNMLEAAKTAGAHEFICTLPEGYETMVGEGGLALSGGESQRIALARVFYRDAPLLILDEPASALDAAGEHHLTETIYKLIEGRTALIIAHRLSTIAAADRILVFADGRIEEMGSKEELMKNQGYYAELLEAYRGAQ